LVRRLRAPYGLAVRVGPLVDPHALGEALLPAFRRYRVVSRLDPLRGIIARYRSSLLLFSDAAEAPAGALDLSATRSLDECVRRVLEHLNGRGTWRTGGSTRV
jgi:hypothetical protein